MFAYWQRKCANIFAPSRIQIDPTEIPEFLPRITLCDVLVNPLTFRYRLSGTEICNMHGVELTHKSVLDLKPPVYGALLHTHYTECYVRKRPFQHAIQFLNPERAYTYVRLLLPLSLDGRAVDMLMTLDSVVGDRKELRMLFEEL